MLKVSVVFLWAFKTFLDGIAVRQGRLLPDYFQVISYPTIDTIQLKGMNTVIKYSTEKS
jgi:hypothetical protein